MTIFFQNGNSSKTSKRWHFLLFCGVAQILSKTVLLCFYSKQLTIENWICLEKEKSE